MSTNYVSINRAITVDDHEIVDDLGLIDDTVTVQIVDALFTSTNADWAVDDPDSPFFIKNKPTRTSAFENNGADGTSRYVEFKDLPSIVGRVADVQVKTASEYVSVLEDGIAKIDLTGYVQKELKTGSQSVYKVLSDNNLSDELLGKINRISLLGNGDRALTDDGTYKDIYNILRVNGVSPDGNKNVNITPNDILFGGVTLSSILEKAVTFDSSSQKNITLDNGRAIKSKNNIGTAFDILKLDSNNLLNLGSVELALKLLSSERPKVNTEDLAYLSDIQDAVSAHNQNSGAHEDIRAALLSLYVTGVIFATNQEMTDYLTSGDLEDGKIVMAVDDGVYIAGKFYKFVEGTPNSFVLVSNYQYENLYGAGAPSSGTAGRIGQLYYDILNFKIYRCINIQSGGIYSWEDVTPGQGNSEAIQGILNNTRLISDANGGFTAGNNFVLLLPDGTIPSARLPQNVLTGLKYGGSFDTNGIITASSNCPELDQTNISQLSLPPYTNYYFFCAGAYTLGGENYVPGQMALDGGNEWVKIANVNQVDSVNGKTGVVFLVASDVGAIPATEKGAVSGVASLDSSGKLTSGQVPVDVASHISDITGNPHHVTAAQTGAYTKGEVDTTTTGLGNRISALEGVIPDDATSSNKVTSKSYVDNADSGLSTRITAIENVVPSDATPSNQLADKSYVDSAVNGLTAYYITRDAAGDPFRTKAELDGTSTFYSGGVVRTPTKNDYLYVQNDESKATLVSGYTSFSSEDDYVGYYVMYNYNSVLVTDSNKNSLSIDPGVTPAYLEMPSTRYIYVGVYGSGGSWQFQFIVNNTGFNSTQMAAINSGINRVLVTKLNGVEAGAEVNKIDVIKDPEGNTLPIVGKTVNLVSFNIVRL